MDFNIWCLANFYLESFSKFWNEEWLKKAISEVDLRAMTAEQKLAYEMTLSANALAIKNENKKIKMRFNLLKLF